MLARLDAISKDMLDVDSMRVVDVLERLPTKIPGKWVFCCYLTDSPARDLYGMFLRFGYYWCWTNLKNFILCRCNGASHKEC